MIRKFSSQRSCHFQWGRITHKLFALCLLWCLPEIVLGQIVSITKSVEINSSTPNGPMLPAGHFFGSSVDNMGDLDGDGVNDMVVGANNGPNGGSVYLLFLNSDGSVKSHNAINSATPNVPDLADEDGFGSSVANMGDLDGNGFADLAVGAAGDHDGGFAKGGRLLIVSPRELDSQKHSSN